MVKKKSGSGLGGPESVDYSDQTKIGKMNLSIQNGTGSKTTTSSKSGNIEPPPGKMKGKKEKVLPVTQDEEERFVCDSSEGPDTDTDESSSTATENHNEDDCSEANEDDSEDDDDDIEFDEDDSEVDDDDSENDDDDMEGTGENESSEDDYDESDYDADQDDGANGNEDSDEDMSAHEEPFKFDNYKGALNEQVSVNVKSKPNESKIGDEYTVDSSDEEDLRNTIGNVPLHWYDEYPHIGYDLDGKKLIKPKMGDKLDDFLRRMENPDFWRTVKDKHTGQNVILSDNDLELINRIQNSGTPDVFYDNYAPWIEWFSSEVMETPLRAIPLSKASFLPSKSEKMKISRMVHAIKMGWMKPKQEISTEEQYYNLWDKDKDAEQMRRIHNHIPAPKMRLPSNAESYHPPAEYLFDEKELKDWKYHDDEPWRRRYNFIPQQYPNLRTVPSYDLYIKERFERCLDLYLCPRAKKMRLTIKAEDLVPQLPSPKDLQPFPTILSMVYKGHTDMVRSISLEPFGQFFASGSDDGSVKIWEVSTGRCMKTFSFGETVRCVQWCPNKTMCLIAVAYGSNVALINPGVGDKLICEKTDTILGEHVDQGNFVPSERISAVSEWEAVDTGKWDNGIRIMIRHFKTVREVTWHVKGDYFATVMPDGLNRSVLIHQLSSRRSQLPLTKSNGLIQTVTFHPIRPYFFVATQRHVRIYDLVKQEVVKKLMTGSKWISSISIHPGGDNVLLGTYDKKVLWFDLDLSTKPYQALRYHGNAVRSVAFHKRYPLFASGSDDCSLIVSHGMVYNDFLQNPLIVPVKKLRGHEKSNDFGILNVMFHNMQPWVFSSGADCTVHLYT